MPLAEFAAQLQALRGKAAQLQEPSKISFEYVIPHGRFRGTEITLGFEVPGDFPSNPPGGPHIRPQLLPLNPGAPAHPNRVASSSFGPDWEYWSRRFDDWASTDRSVKTYMAFVRSLFDFP